ncbi:hemerythrin domain-containing protein [Comamonas flocculans]|uniref:Hemerythrin domain-containing protein n=1 Tax=Comamonas flocculans TaxID=2597701 RepID=A0A5B8RW17_9BURK|nr:hemerythrin domain-containing protein [Comamonas flocculans]QEA12902.1 hemerythrin domain-containing protein [Comamonas flocculans]
MNIDKFKADHLAILSGIQRLRDLTRLGVPAADEIAAALVKFSTTIRLHLAAEDKFLYPSLEKSQDPQIVAMSQRFEREMADIAQRFMAFARNWNVGAKIAADFDGFRRAANLTLKPVWDRMQQENREFYPRIEAM